MRWAVAAAVPLLAGCDLLFGLDGIGALPPDADVSQIDADLGVLVDAGPCALPAQTFGRFGVGGSGLFSQCITPSIGGAYALDGLVDTDSDPRCLFVAQDTIGTKVCVIASEDIEINATLVTRGESPLVILGFKTIKVNALLHAAARVAGTGGAGSNWIGCGSPANGPNHLNGGGGGPGGSFGTAGGNGGNNAAGNAGQAKPAAQPDRIRGGCSGGMGGSNTIVLRTPFGSGGGAVYLIAGTSIELTASARINVSGAGGPGGATSGNSGGAGGGGAGAGGLIGLDTPQLIIHAEARLLANGGGGGGGGGEIDGAPGSDPGAGSITTQAPGGTGSQLGGAGGAGGANDLAGDPGAQSKAGGGGGGGVGVIKVYTPSPPAQPTNVSPPWQTN